jgi:hypothetical protein
LLNDLFSQNDESDLLTEMCINNDTGSSITLPQRKSEDLLENEKGKDLINFCKTVNLFIINGRLGKDKDIGRLTCKDASVVDYFIASKVLFHQIADFEVHEFCDLLSDVHCAVTLKITLKSAENSMSNESIKGKTESQKSDVKTENCLKPRWKNDKQFEYVSAININDLNEIDVLLTQLHENPDTVTNDVINVAVAKINDVMKNAGKSADLFPNKKRHQRKKKKRSTDQQPWFDKECEVKRKLFFKAKNLYKVARNDNNRKSKKKASKDYKDATNKSFTKFQKKLAKKLRCLRKKDPKSYWKILNGSDAECSELLTKLTSEAFLQHFKGLATQPENATESECPNNNDGTVNEELNRLFSTEEIIKAIRKLKSNKSCASDQIINEFLKASPEKLSPILAKLFNIILLSGKVPTEWTIGEIIPIYKNKGSRDVAGNYRGITILSCFGKLFTSVVNNRLTEFLDSKSGIGTEQAGFRSGFSTMDHIFTVYSIIDYFLSQKQRLYCLFIDYEKAFDKINRTFLWQKLLNTGINGPVLNIIKELYARAKSCVRFNNSQSDLFQCDVGVRQGENLSPLLFAIFLNDLQPFIKEKVQGLSSLADEARDISMSDTEINLMLKMFILLYADDTVICSESPEELQEALDAMADYCNKWQLKVNATKTKVMVFSRGKVQKLPSFQYNGSPIDVVYEFPYLGVLLNYNNRFLVAQKHLYDKASRAKFALLKKCKKLMLPIDIQIELFDKMIAPILLYGSEIWAPQMSNLASRLQIDFYKTVLMLRKSTPTCMVYGETGQFPLEIEAKCRMLCFWYKLVQTPIENKLSLTMYRFLYKLYKKEDSFRSPYLTCVKTTLENLGLNEYWINQGNLNISPFRFKNIVKRKLKDQYIQEWKADVDSKSSCYNYRQYKQDFGLEKYTTRLSNNNIRLLARFRTLNHKLPVQMGRYNNVPRNERICEKCDMGVLGDEYHYLLICPQFAEQRKRYIPTKYFSIATKIKFGHLLSTKSRNILLRLTNFIRAINKQF